MYLIFVSIIVAAVVAAALFKYADGGCDLRHLVAGWFGVVVGIGAGIGALVSALLVWGWVAAEHEARIINREYGTNYTQAEVFYASGVIETIRQLDRKRYEVNGDLMRGQKEEQP